MTWAGIVAGQVGAAIATRTTRASLRQIGFLTNKYLLRGIAFELAFAAAIIYLPPLQSLFHTAPLVWWQLVLLASFPVLVWGTDETYRAWQRRRTSPLGPVRRARPAPPEVRDARA